ncbi:MAG: ATP-binding protein [Anaerolineae bacterium]|nr:ATP-binding protein [Anaerolineae bacterium]
METILFIGIQATGKSTFYRQRFEDTHIRINLDMLKTRYRERILFEACIAAKQPLVIDNTNLTVGERTRYIIPAKAAGFCVIGYYFKSSISEAIERNRQRAASKVIPEKGIAGAHKRLQLPSLEEGFDALYYVTIDPAGEFSVEEWHDGL